MKLKAQLAELILMTGVALALVACSGGGSVLGSVGSALKTTFSGSAVDAAIANAQITITSVAPLNDTGATTIGTFMANASGVFTSSVTLPAGDVPVFGNAVDPHNSAVVLSSYLGQSSALSAASGVLTSANLPDLDITPVTTAALAVYFEVNGQSYTSLTPATYATNLQNFNSDILAIAAAIKAVGDNLCTPSITVSSTTNLAASIAFASNLSGGNSTTLATAATILGGNCATVLASLPQRISADPVFSPGLYVGDVIDAGVSCVVSGVPAVTPGTSGTAAGTYTLESVVAESGWSTTAASAVTPNPASIFTDTTVAVDSSGIISSTDGLVSGTMVGNLITLTVTDGTQQYSLRGKVGVVQTTLVSGGTAYSIQGGGTNTSSGVLTNFTAVLASAGTSPVWNGNTAPTTTICPSGDFPVRLDAYGSGIGGGGVSECILPNANGWSMSASTQSVASIGDHNNSSTPPGLSAPTWSEVSTDAPFILSAANASFTGNGTASTGTMYYVMGSASVVFANTTGNNLLGMNGNSLTRLTESVVSTATTAGGSSLPGIMGNIGNQNRSFH